MALLRRREVLLGTTALCVGACATTRPASGGPPLARVQSVVDTHYGVTVSDPYRWMEDSNDPDWLSFLQGQNTYTRSVLDRIPGRARLLERINAYSGETTLTGGIHARGDRLFFERRPAGADNYKLFVREADGRTRVLIDPTIMSQGGAHVSLDWWRASDDGGYVVYGLSAAGSEASVLHVMNTASGEILPERIEKTDFAYPAWLPDGSGFYYLQYTGERGTPSFYFDAQVRFHALRAAPADDPVVLKRGMFAEIPMSVEQSPVLWIDSKAGVAFAAVVDVRSEFAAWMTPLDALRRGAPRWRPICDFDDLVTSVVIMGGALYALASRDAIRGQVLKTSATAPDLTTAQVAIPESGLIIDGLSVSRTGVFVWLHDGGVSKLRRIDATGAVADIALPYEGSFGLTTARDRDEAYLNMIGWLAPPSIWRYDPQTGALVETDLQPRPNIDVSPYESRRVFTTARDGVRVPMTIIARRSEAERGPKSCFVTAYGAYESVHRPSFSPTLLPFLDEGGVYVVAHVRGGGEYGREWHEAGMRTTKPNTWRDLIDCCEELIRLGVTTRDKLAIEGVSAGGIPVGRALTERPDLFAAAISRVGWHNCLRYVAEQNSLGEKEEWGTLDDEEGFRGLLAMDSYQAVRDGVRYPAVLLTTGATDPRVAPFNAAKMAARLQAATSSDNPVLLRVDFDAGHGVGSTRTQTDALRADTYAFALWRTGHRNFQPRRR